MKREKQLKSQIDNLITDSLNLLKTRLSELGIQAKTPPEFIEKAKGIVCQHHELQRNKASVENEVRQLELEQEKIIQTKEKEMLEHLLKQGINSIPENQIFYGKNLHFFLMFFRTNSTLLPG